MFYLNKQDAKSLAKSLTKRLGAKHPEMALGHVLDALAQTKGFLDWNAYSASFGERTVNQLLHPFELAHAHDSGMADMRAEDTGSGGYGAETTVQAHTGFYLKCPSHEQCPEGADYLRVCDPLGREVAYWTHEEWREDPLGVMGAVMGALVRGDTADLGLRDEPEQPRIVDVPFDELSGIVVDDANGHGWFKVDHVEAIALKYVLQPDSFKPEELVTHAQDVVVSLSFWEDGVSDAKNLTVEDLRALKWCPDKRLFTNGNGDSFEFVLAKSFGR